MRPRRTLTSTHVFELAGGNEDNSLWLTAVEGGPGEGTQLVSVWELTAAEREAIAAGANIELRVWGTGHPPVLLRTTTDPVGAAAP